MKLVNTGAAVSGRGLLTSARGGLRAASAHSKGWALLTWVLLLPSSAWTSDIHWTNPAGGNWSDPANWSSGALPGSSDNVFITQDGTYTVTLDVDATALSLSVGASTGQQTFLIAGNALVLLNSSVFRENTVFQLKAGSLGGQGTIEIDGAMHWSGGTMRDHGVTVFGPKSMITLAGGTIRERKFTNFGQIVWREENYINVEGDPTALVFNNRAGAVFDIQTGTRSSEAYLFNLNDYNGPKPTFNNEGTLRKSVGLGNVWCEMDCNNMGLVVVENGSLSLWGQGTSSGIFTVKAGALLSLAGKPEDIKSLTETASINGEGSFLVDRSQVTHAGEYDILGSTSVSYGTLDLSGNIKHVGQVPGENLPSVGTSDPALNNGNVLTLFRGYLSIDGDLTIDGKVGFHGHELRVTGNLTLNGEVDWTEGTLAQAGVTTFGRDSAITLSEGGKAISGGTIDNFGKVAWKTGRYIDADQGVVFNNKAGAKFEIQTQGSGGFNLSYLVFNNAGLFRQSRGTNITLDATVTLLTIDFFNTGTVKVESGALSFKGNGASSGNFTVDAGAVLDLPGREEAARHTYVLSESAAISGAGTFIADRGEITHKGIYNITGSTYLWGSIFSLQGPVLSVGQSPSTNLPDVWEGNGPKDLNNGCVLTDYGELFYVNADLAFDRSVIIDGNLEVRSNLTFNAQLDWRGYKISAPGTVTFGLKAIVTLSRDDEAKRLSRATINNLGTVIWNGKGGWEMSDGAILNNQGLLDIRDDAGLYNFGEKQSFNNSGIVRKSGGTNFTTIAVPFFNRGVMEAASGTLLIHDLTLLSDSRLRFDINGVAAGTEFGQMGTWNSTRLGGALDLHFGKDFLPSPDDAFRLLTWRFHSGGFSQVNVPDLGPDRYAQSICDPAGLSLVVRSVKSTSAAPATNLVNQATVIGGSAIFHIEPIGQEPLTYRWQFKGVDLDGQTGPTLALANVQAKDAGEYCVTVIDGQGFANTSCALLQVLDRPTIQKQPLPQIVVGGADATLSVLGGGSPPLQYQWRRNGEWIIGATNASLLFTNAQPGDGGRYSVLVANPVGLVQSQSVEFQVVSAPLSLVDNFVDRVSINSFSGSGSGNNGNFSSEANEPPHAGKRGGHSGWMAWRAPADGVAKFSTRGSSFDTLLAVYTGDTLESLADVTHQEAHDDDSGGFFTSEVIFKAKANTAYAIVVDGFAGRVGNIVLSWTLDTSIGEVPRFFTEPLSQTTSAGNDVTFGVDARASGPVFYQWFFNDCLAIPGATNASLTITNVRVSDVGFYSLEASSASGQAVESDPAVLELGPSGITAQSRNKFEDLFEAVRVGLFEARAVGNGGFPMVSAGFFGSQNINNFNSPTEDGAPALDDTPTGTTRWYQITASDNATMEIDTAGSDIQTALAVYVGNDLSNLKEIASDRNSAPDGIHSLVRFPAVAGTTYVVASGGINTAQGNIYLNFALGNPPVIQSAPADQLISEGSAVSVMVLATGELRLEGSATVKPLSYRWFFNGLPIPGATASSLAISRFVLTAAGKYRVEVANQIGTASREFTLSIAPTLRLVSPTIVDRRFQVKVIGLNNQRSLVIETSPDLAQWAPIFTNGAGTSLSPLREDNSAGTRTFSIPLRRPEPGVVFSDSLDSFIRFFRAVQP